MQEYRNRLDMMGISQNNRSEIEFIGFFINLCVNKYHLISVYEMNEILEK